MKLMSSFSVSWKEEIANKSEGKYALALGKYDEAIKLNPDSAIYLSNRAFAYTKLEQYGAAIVNNFVCGILPKRKMQLEPFSAIRHMPK
jgi:tetratricopeptide (TPR) repeat protein